MGAPKQKWTAEEEAALRAGVLKHGAGKWQTILKDPEFNRVLILRSNVDLKDKWRNMSVIAHGWSSREKGRIALKRTQSSLRHDDNPFALDIVQEEDFDNEIVDVKPLAIQSGPLQVTGPKKPFTRFDILIFEAIENLKEAKGSNMKAITTYIEDNYLPPPDFKRLLSEKLAELTLCGRLMKVKSKYRLAPHFTNSDRKDSNVLALGVRRESSRLDSDDIKLLIKSQVDADLDRMRSLTPQEAADIAAQAIAEAEAAIAEAEEASRLAEAAEAEAEAAQALADAVMLVLKGRSAARTVF